MYVTFPTLVCGPQLGLFAICPVSVIVIVCPTFNVPGNVQERLPFDCNGELDDQDPIGTTHEVFGHTSLI